MIFLSGVFHTLETFNIAFLDGLSTLSVFSSFWKFVLNSWIICLPRQLTKHKEASALGENSSLHEKNDVVFLSFSLTFIFRDAQDGTKYCTSANNVQHFFPR